MEKHHSSTYLKMRVLGAIDMAPGKTIRDRIREVANMSFIDDHGASHKFTWRTIETWRSRYNKDGITSMLNKNRSDKGKTRKVEPREILEAIDQVLPFFNEKKFNKSEIYRACVEKGLIRPEEFARTTFYHFITRYDLLQAGQINPKIREAWSKLYANQLWQGDSMQGPPVIDNGQSKPAWLIAFIDDASRVVVHGQFFFKNDADSLMITLQNAIYKRGIPDQIYVDNGSNYKSAEITLVCARIGILLLHTPVNDGAAKGKIERFFRTVRQNFLCRKLDLSSLEILNKEFCVWLENDYNNKIHSTLQMKPIDRFGLDSKKIRFLPPCMSNDELFFLEKKRFVKNDNTFSFKKVRYEAPRDLRRRDIQIRFNRFKPSAIVVYYKNERMGEARILNPYYNDKARKETLQ
jgi:hypothetical protein